MTTSSRRPLGRRRRRIRLDGPGAHPGLRPGAAPLPAAAAAPAAGRGRRRGARPGRGGRRASSASPPPTRDWRELAADPGVQAVSIAAPNFLHREIGVAMAQAGKHIWIEKPVGLTAADAQAVADAVQRGRRAGRGRLQLPQRARPSQPPAS